MKHFVIPTIALLFASCQAPTFQVEEADVPAGVVSGRVVMSDPVPNRTIERPGERWTKCCPELVNLDLTDRRLEVGAGGTVKNAVVSVSVEGVDTPAPDDPVRIEIRNCRFEPRVTVVPVGTTLEILNQDGGHHNIHTYPRRNAAVNRSVAAGAASTLKVERPEAFRITDDLHPWMECWIYVTDSSYYAVTDSEGSFRMQGLPPGEHTLRFWHPDKERIGKGQVPFELAADQGRTLNVPVGN